MREIPYPDPKIGATILALISFLAVPCFSAPVPVSEPTFEVTVEENLMIPMRDGTRLAADIYKPVGAGPSPIILQRTPYDKLGSAVVKLAHDYASRGYVVVLQDTRGRFASEGEFRNYLDDGWGKRQDGYDTIEWLAKQPWSNGKTGTFGNSYPGTIQYLTAVTRPPHLTAMFVSNAAADFYQEVRYHGGAFMGHAVRWQVSNQAFTRRVSTSEDWGMLLEASPPEKALSLDALISPTFLEWVNNPTDGAFWWQMGAYRKFDEIEVPTYHHGGWFDRFRRGITKSFAGISAKGRSETGRRVQKLIMGPWPHSSQSMQTVGGVDFGPEAALDIDLLRLRWFDFWLKGIDNGIMDEPPVQIFVMGDNTWRQEKEWPPARAVPTDYYLRAGAVSRPVHSLNDGGLATVMPGSDEKSASFRYDPRKPLPTIGGDTRFGEEGPRDQSEVEKGSLTYTSDPLVREVEVTGYPEVTLHVSSNAPDTDFVVILADVSPDGKSRILSRNLLRAKYYKTFEKAELLNPGQTYELKIEMSPTSHVFKNGHRIRLSVSSSSFPAWIPNPNTGKDFKDGGPARVAINTVYQDSQRNSRITLPVIPRGGS